MSNVKERIAAIMATTTGGIATIRRTFTTHSRPKRKTDGITV